MSNHAANRPHDAKSRVLPRIPSRRSPGCPQLGAHGRRVAVDSPSLAARRPLSNRLAEAVGK